jgi:UDP-N-acetylglucosamine:LPS N-acetylglucosamine transferase
MTVSLRLEVERRLQKLAPDCRYADLIISTHPLLHPRCGQKKIMVLLDPVVHAVYTVKPRPDYYFTFWSETLPDVKRWGIRTNKIIHVGPLARPSFYQTAASQIDFLKNNQQKMALVIAGSAWMSRASDYLDLLKTSFKNENIVFVFICGKNQSFVQEMSSKYRRFKNFKFLGWLSEVEVAAWMRAADFALAFSLAQMSVEAGLCRLPIFILRLIEGQEDGYREVLENRGVGMFLPGDPASQVALLKLLYPHTKELFGKNLVVWQKELLAVPNKLKKIISDL